MFGHFMLYVINVQVFLRTKECYTSALTFISIKLFNFCVLTHVHCGHHDQGHKPETLGCASSPAEVKGNNAVSKVKLACKTGSKADTN